MKRILSIALHKTEAYRSNILMGNYVPSEWVALKKYLESRYSITIKVDDWKEEYLLEKLKNGKGNQSHIYFEVPRKIVTQFPKSKWYT